MILLNVITNELAFGLGAISALILVLAIFLITRPGSLPPPKGGLFFEVVFNNQKFQVTRMDFSNIQFVEGTVKATDVKGDDAPIQAGSVKAVSRNEDKVTTEVDEDGKVKLIGQRAGAFIVDITADADLGDGVKTISLEVGGNVTGSEATGLGVQFGEPQNQ